MPTKPDEFECEGRCATHRGHVSRVSVCGEYTYWDEFWYCAEAIREARRNGLTVQPIEGGD